MPIQLGYSAARSVILMLLVIAPTALPFRYAEKEGHVLMGRSGVIAHTTLVTSRWPRP